MMHEQVRKLDVAMDDSNRVCRAEGAENLPHQRDRFDSTERTALPDFVRKGGACEPLHHQVRASIRRGAEVDDVDDRRMAKLGQRLGLDARVIHEPRISCHLGVQQLHYEPFAELAVIGEIHLPHAASADERDSSVLGADERIVDQRVGLAQILIADRRLPQCAHRKPFWESTSFGSADVAESTGAPLRRLVACGGAGCYRGGVDSCPRFVADERLLGRCGLAVADEIAGSD
jgi:hypothetical protein